jgi:hypothetical protein
VAEQKKVVEVNGNHYDAVTGELVRQKGNQVQKLKLSSHYKGKNVDGFTRRVVTKSPHSTTKKTLPSHTIHSKTKRSDTLMRSAVKPPKVQSNHSGIKTTSDLLTPGKHVLDKSRLTRSKVVKKNDLVSRFGATSSNATINKLADIPVKERPKHNIQTYGVSMPIDDIPPLNAGSIGSFDNSKTFDQSSKLSSNSPNHQTKASKKKLRRSISKRLKKGVKRHPRFATVGVSLLVVLSVGGFVASRYLPQMAVKVAATRAGVDAKLPTYQPSGFSLSGPVTYSPGQITLLYSSNSDERSFQLTQKKSDWTSQSLLDNFIVSANHRYQTFQDKGKTIYIYDGNNATWVSGGVWYQIEGESSLSSDQLLRVISGL